MVKQHLAKFHVIVARLIAWLLFRGPVTVNAGRHRLVFDPASGRLMAAVGGAEGEGEGEGGEGGGGEEEGEGGEGGTGGEGEEEGEGSGEGGGDSPGKRPADDASADEWKAWAEANQREARKWEGRAKNKGGRGRRDRETPALKREREAREAAEAKLKEFEDKDKSETERAIEKAREETRTEVTTAAQKERRADRLDLEVTRLATRGVKLEVEDDDGKLVEKTVKFADPDDALAHLERAIKRGDVDGDGLFDDKDKVQKDEVTEALAELLEDKPHLAAKDAGSNGDGKKRERPKGGADGGKGSGGGKGPEDMTTEEIAAKMQKGSK